MRTALFFSNGMFNSYESAEESLNALSLAYGATFASYDVAYNFNEPLHRQLVQVFFQKLGATHRFLWSYFSLLNAPDFFVHAAEKMARMVTARHYVNDEDLREHVRKLSAVLKKDLAVLIVAHSQGNFYANRAFEVLTEQIGADPERIGIVGVASPDSYVAGGGDYRTLHSDRLVRSIPHSMPANVRNQTEGNLDHQFIRHYLKGDRSGPEILKIVLESTQ